MNKKSLTNLLLSFLAILFIGLITLGVNIPYVGPNAANFNNYSLIAKNYNSFGFLNTKFAEIVSISKDLPVSPAYYLNHPPLLTIIQAFVFRVFGYDFWVGRSVVILFSLGSLFLIYLIGKQLLGNRFAIISSCVYILIPASTVFGKMIGQESLVLFFALSTIFGILRYLKSRSKKYIILIISSVFLGTLSDWPMTYFSFLVSAYLFHKKEKGLAIWILITSFLTAFFYLIYIYLIKSGLSEIAWAITVRSVGSLFVQPYWFVKWISVIILRFILYFNPLFVILGFYFFITNAFKRLKSEEEKELRSILLVLFCFGAIHIFLYPDGSFGHPYWLYYFIPFIVFSSSFVIEKLLKTRKRYLYLILVFSLIFSFLIQHWKLEQTKANLWRYSLGQKFTANLNSYEKIQINVDSAVDRELIGYVFSHEVKLVSKISEIDSRNYDHFIYSCSSRCDMSGKLILFLSNNYVSENVVNDHGEAYIFNLKSKRLAGLNVGNISAIEVDKSINKDSDSVLKNIYKSIVRFLSAPQI